MRSLNMSKDAFKFADGLDAKQYRQVIRKTLALMSEPQPHDSIEMKGHDLYRTDIGEFRIVYWFDEEMVWIEVIGKRNDDEVYRNIKRR